MPTIPDGVPGPPPSARNRGGRGPADHRAALVDDLDRLLAAARPRLARLALARGVPLDAADDVAQDTLLAAWRRLAYLREPGRFDAWLDGICRNMCLHYLRDARTAALWIAPQGGRPADPVSGDGGEPDEIPDGLGFDPVEHLQRQDLGVLLDRALGYLPPEARTTVELHYLAELPQAETALRLALDVHALEMRLHRARRQLRRVLHGPLRVEAEACGLVLDPDEAAGWRPTREWCPLCAQGRLEGLFEPRPDGSTRLRMRCPACTPRHGKTIFDSEKVARIEGMVSFRAAYKRARALEKGCYAGALAPGAPGRQRCPRCGAQATARFAEPGELAMPGVNHYWIVIVCATCQARSFSDALSILCWTDPIAGPAARLFRDHHPRSANETAQPVTHAGQPAIRFRIADVAGAGRLTILAHADTLRVLHVAAE